MAHLALLDHLLNCLTQKEVEEDIFEQEGALVLLSGKDSRLDKS